MAEQKVQLKYLRLAPRKVRLLADLIRGRSLNEAEAELSLSPRRAALPLIKLLRAAATSASSQKKMNADRLFIKSITVNQGPMLKRYLPRARGSASPIQKKSSHVTLILAEDEKLKTRFRFITPAKDKDKIKPAKERPAVKPKDKKLPPVAESAEPDREPGVLKRIFRRKSV